MKKVFSVIALVLVLVLVFTACSQQVSPTPTPTTTAPTTSAAPTTTTAKPTTSAAPATTTAKPSTSAAPAPTTGAAVKVPTLTAPVQLRIAAMGPGTSLYLWSAAQAEIFKAVLPKGSVIDVLPAAGGIANIKMVDNGQAELSWTTKAQDSWAVKGWAGGGFEKATTNVRTLATTFTEMQIGFFASKKLGVTSVEDVISKKLPIKLVTMPVGSGGEQAARLMLGEYGVTYDDIKSWGGSVVHTAASALGDMLKNGTSDTAIGYWGPTHPTATDVFASREMVILSMAKTHIDSMVSKYGFLYSPYPKGCYKGVEAEVPTIGDSHEFNIMASIPDDVAFVLAKALVDNIDRLVATSADLKPFSGPVAGANPGAPLHPGALAYYKAAGFLK